MALTAGFPIARRGQHRGGTDFGYPVAPGEKVFRGGICALNAAGQIVRPQTAGALVFAGVADRDLDNTASAAPSTTYVVAMRGAFALAVPAATASNINAKVYATDDAVLTLAAPASGFVAEIGVLAGIEGGQTYVQMVGS